MLKYIIAHFIVFMSFAIAAWALFGFASVWTVVSTMGFAGWFIVFAAATFVLVFIAGIMLPFLY